MNFIDAQVTASGLRLSNGVILPLGDAWATGTAGRVTFGVRPEHLRLSEPGAGAIPGIVSMVEPTGAETTLMVKTDAGTMTALLRERASLAPGHAIALTPTPGCGHLFDERGTWITSV